MIQQYIAFNFTSSVTGNFSIGKLTLNPPQKSEGKP